MMTTHTNINPRSIKKNDDSDDTEQIFDNPELHISENNLFTHALDAIKTAKNSSNADNKRAKRLNEMLTEFQDISNTPANTPELIALKSRMLCELIARNKDIFLDR